MSETEPAPRLSAWIVLLSIIALWGCYFIVATLRGAFMGLDWSWEILSLRLIIVGLSMAVFVALWPLVRLLDGRRLWVRVLVVVIAALPVSVLLAAINDAVFADINARLVADHGEGAEDHKSVRVTTDEEGNLLIDLPNVTTPPATDADSGSGGEPAAGEVRSVTIETPDPDGQKLTILSWRKIIDSAFGRYFLVLAWAALYFALSKAELARAAERREGEFRRAAADAELRSLRYQVNPHFLFNTLNSLSALVMTGRSDEAEEMIQTLSTFYRRTLTSAPTADLSLCDEIELQQLYLAIEAVRFPQRLQYRIDAPEAVCDAQVPGMILQPLVENSVKYAVAACTDPVTITIAARRDGGDIVVSVSDNGPGTGNGDPEGCGIGLGNVRDRLKARFGEAASLTFGPRQGGGFETAIRMPYIVREAEPAPKKGLLSWLGNGKGKVAHG